MPFPRRGQFLPLSIWLPCPQRSPRVSVDGRWDSPRVWSFHVSEGVSLVHTQPIAVRPKVRCVLSHSCGDHCFLPSTDLCVNQCKDPICLHGDLSSLEFQATWFLYLNLLIGTRTIKISYHQGKRDAPPTFVCL